MKIGILTFHRASNYGAVLQAYALQTVMQNYADTEIVDYYCPQVEKDHKPEKVFQKFGLIKGIVRFPGKVKKYSCFETFRKKYLKLSQKYTADTIIHADYDRFIVGSDQVWSKIFAGLDETYFLNFTEDLKKYSYAASFGFTSFPKGTEKLYREYLSKFQSVSVREKSAELLLKKSNIPVRMDLDPTLLLKKEQWLKLASVPEQDKPYILVYTVQPPINLLKYARTLAEQTGCEILYLNHEYRANMDIRHIRFATPEAFVGWFAKAEYVLTNSFHGTVFGVIFEKKLAVEIQTKKSINTRSENLLTLFGLTKQILKSDHDKLEFHSDWNQVKQRLEAYKKLSLDYLQRITKEEKINGDENS